MPRTKLLLFDSILRQACNLLRLMLQAYVVIYFVEDGRLWTILGVHRLQDEEAARCDVAMQGNNQYLYSTFSLSQKKMNTQVSPCDC